MKDSLFIIIPITLLLLITIILISRPLQKEQKVIVKKEYVPLGSNAERVFPHSSAMGVPYYYRYSHYPNYWDQPRVQVWPVHGQPFWNSYYPVAGYGGSYSGGIRTGSGGSSHR